MENCEMSDQIGEFPSYAYLPVLVLEKVFSYLEHSERFIAGRACRRWYDCSRESTLWRHLYIKNMSSYQFIKLLPAVPSSVKHLRLSCEDFPLSISKRVYDVLAALNKSCPSLESLIIDNADFAAKNFPLSESASGKEAESSCEDHRTEQSNKDASMPELLVISLRHSIFIFDDVISYMVASLLPNLKVMDFTSSEILKPEYLIIFSRFTNLTEIYLADTLIESRSIKILLKNTKGLKVLDLERLDRLKEIFPLLQERGQTIEKLYLGNTYTRDVDFVGELFSNKNCFIRLEELCLRGIQLTDWGIGVILNSCHSLKHVDVSMSLISREWLQGSNGRVAFEGHTKRVHFCKHFKQNHFLSALR